MSSAWVTLATNDSYAVGALVLAASLRRVGTAHKLAIIITNSVTPSMRETLQGAFDTVRLVDLIESGDQVNLALMQRPELGVTWTKLHCWKLTEYSKCVFLDADTLVLQNPDELFEREELSASPDAGWPDIFNTGVFVFRPNETTFEQILALALAEGSFDGGDQGLLNAYFSTWATGDSSKRLPFVYNVALSNVYTYVNAFRRFEKDIKILHFLGAAKPWQQRFDPESRRVIGAGDVVGKYIQLWWDIYCEAVHPQLLNREVGGLAAQLSVMRLGEPRVETYHEGQQRWDEGVVDVVGKDSFDNILKQIEKTLEAGPKREKTPEAVPKPAPVTEAPVVPPPVAPVVEPTPPPVVPAVPEPAPVVEKPAEPAPVPAAKPAPLVTPVPAAPKEVPAPTTPPAAAEATPPASPTSPPAAPKSVAAPSTPPASPAATTAAAAKPAAAPKPAPPAAGKGKPKPKK